MIRRTTIRTQKKWYRRRRLLCVLDFQLVETFTFLGGSGSFWPERVHDGVRDGGTGMNAPREEHDEFRREMNALLHIRACGGHPNICQLRENFEEARDFILVLDLIEGGEMFQYLIDNGAYSEWEAARLIREVASALAFLHGVGLVHADLKPENLMLTSKNKDEATIKVVDFGCAGELFCRKLDACCFGSDMLRFIILTYSIVTASHRNRPGILGRWPSSRRRRWFG